MHKKRKLLAHVVDMILGSQVAFADDDELHRLIKVSGEGESSAAPDMAKIQPGVTNQAKTPDDAKDENNASIVLVTDGRHEGPADEVRQIADTIKRDGIAIVTVGLGENVDRALLEEIASDPSQFYYSPDAEGLEEIYRRIADYIPCP